MILARGRSETVLDGQETAATKRFLVSFFNFDPMAQTVPWHVYRPGGMATPALVPAPYARGRCEDPALEQTLLTCTEQALTLITARRFAEAHAQFELAVSRVRRTQETIPNLRLNLLLFARLLSHYGALLIRSGEFAAAGFYLAQARKCLDRLTVKALLKGTRRTRRRLRMGKGVVDLEQAYLALRQRAYPQAIAQAAQIGRAHV